VYGDRSGGEAVSSLGDGWGPERRRAALTLSFDGIAAGMPAPALVSPALPTVLDLLGRRDLPATFFATAHAAASEPLALTMIANAGNEIGALADDSLRAIDAIEATGRTVHGVSAAQVDRELLARIARRATIRYVSGGGGEIEVADGVVRVPADPDIGAARFLSVDAGLQGGSARGPHAWHAAAQVAIGQAVERRAHVTLPLSLEPLERGDAFSVLVEILDLVHGLRRAGRLWVTTLDELARWWLDRHRRAG
jgi:peptidoglycan/xylan/chitin deacetylase (PgdA/CDA1 family)